MELLDLEVGLKSVASAGAMLNVHEVASVQSGLVALRAKEELPEVYFWGRILGKTSNYFMAYALKDTDFEFPLKTFFYSTNDFDFKPLPQITERVANKLDELDLEGMFSGDPATNVDSPPADADAGDPPPDGADPPKDAVTEAHRLAYVVQSIEMDTAVVPRGAYALNESHLVVRSRRFRGLGFTEAANLESYAHFRAPTSVGALRGLARPDAQFFEDFLDPVALDLPTGCWVVRQDPSLAVVTVRSLAWPGYVAYHMPGTARFGGLYFGYAQKNRDLPFIL